MKLFFNTQTLIIYRFRSKLIASKSHCLIIFSIEKKIAAIKEQKATFSGFNNELLGRMSNVFPITN